jgi:hypothetical protein
MSEIDSHIHSTKTLAKAAVFACAFAAVVFVLIVLPAEYNIDPTGIGGKIGLTVLAPSAASVESSSVEGESLDGARNDQVSIVVPAKSGLEYKFQLAQYGKLQYEWTSGGKELFFDLHGEPDGGEPGFFESYAEATASEMKGTLTAPFAGSHGWYWRNRSDEEATVTLKTSGSYQVIGLN